MGIAIEFLKGHEVATKFGQLANEVKEIDLAIAYFSKTGYELIEPSLKNFILKKKGTLKLLVGLSRHYLTDADPLKSISKLGEKAQGHVQMKYFTSNAFHAKYMIFKNKNCWSLILGSSNFTGGGLQNNVEANLLLSCEKPIDLQIKKANDFFEALWKTRKNGGAKELTIERIDEYSKEKKEFEKNKESNAVKKRLPDSEIPTDISEKPQPKLTGFKIYLNGKESVVKQLYGECVICNTMVKISKTWAKSWQHIEHGKGKTYFNAPEPKEKPATIKLLVDGTTRFLTGDISVQCFKCNDPLESTSDFYWLICSKCYNTLPRNKRCKVYGFKYNLPRNKLWHKSKNKQ